MTDSFSGLNKPIDTVTISREKYDGMVSLIKQASELLKEKRGNAQ